MCGLTLYNELDMVRDGTDRVAERARVQTAVGRAEADQSNALPDDRHVTAGNQLAAVLAPREGRRRRRRRLAKHVDRVALFLDQQTRRRLSQYRRSCVTHQSHAAIRAHQMRQ